MNRILPGGFGLGESELRILLRGLGETVMGEMEIAEPIGGKGQHEARDARDGFVEPGAAERRLMDRLVQEREQERDRYALRDHQQRPERHLERDERAQAENRAEMEQEQRQAGKVRLRSQVIALLLAQGSDDLSVVHLQ